MHVTTAYRVALVVPISGCATSQKHSIKCPKRKVAPHYLQCGNQLTNNTITRPLNRIHVSVWQRGDVLLQNRANSQKLFHSYVPFWL